MSEITEFVLFDKVHECSTNYTKLLDQVEMMAYLMGLAGEIERDSIGAKDGILLCVRAAPLW